jgi:hypothetical protein
MSAEDTARIKASKEIEKALDEQFKIDDWWYSSLSFCWTADTPEDMRLRPEVERRFRRVYY